MGLTTINRWIEAEPDVYIKKIKDNLVQAQLRTSSLCPDCRKLHNDGRIHWSVVYYAPFEMITGGVAYDEDSARERAHVALTEMRLLIN